MTGDERLAKVAEVLHGQIDGDFLIGADGWSDGDLAISKAGPADVVRWATSTLGPLLDEFRAEDEMTGQMRHISAEVARGDVPLSDVEEMIADLRARLSHVEAERNDLRAALDAAESEKELRARLRAVAPRAIADAEQRAQRVEARARADVAAVLAAAEPDAGER